LVNWIDRPTDPPKPFVLDGREVAGIGPDLTESLIGDWVPRPLAANVGRCFQGMTPVGSGFILSEEEATRLRIQDADNTQVVRRYLTGDDIAQSVGQSAQRWIIDFGQRSLEDASRFGAALDILRKRVKPEREINRDRFRRTHWWRFGRPYTAVRDALAPLRRFAGGNRVGKRLLLAWFDVEIVPSDKAQVFVFQDDFSMGVLTSRGHGAWAWHQGATLKGDLAYTPTSVFATFAWPDQATEVQRERVAEASRRLLARRSEICLAEQIGLTTLYNRVETAPTPTSPRCTVLSKRP